MYYYNILVNETHSFNDMSWNSLSKTRLVFPEELF